MDNFRAVYRISTFLRKSERYDEFDDESFTPRHFHLAEKQFALTLERMIDDGYIKGVSVKFGADGRPDYVLSAPRITSRGLEYLYENPLMREAARIAKGIR
jgi:hypothetical protein